MKHGMLYLMVIWAVLMIGGCGKEDPVSSATGDGSDVSLRKAVLPSQDQSSIGENRSKHPNGKYHRLYLRANFTTASVVLTPPPPFPLSGTQVMTVANGDKLFTSFMGNSAPPDPNGDTYITNSQKVTGGTGRFAGATGTLAGKAVAHSANPIGTATLEGTIYVRHGDDDGGTTISLLGQRN